MALRTHRRRMSRFKYGGAVGGTSGGGGSTTYGAPADAGEVNDATLAATYSTATTYSEGDVVVNAGTYYLSLQDGNLNQLLSNATYWFQIAKFYYFAAAGSDSNVGSTNPATAKAAPLQTLDAAFSLVKSGGAAPANSLLVFNRGETFTGTIYTETVCAFGAYGSGARPILQFADHLGQGYSNVIKMTVKTTVHNLVLDARRVITYPFTSTAGTLVAGDVVTDGTINATVAVAPGGTGTLQCIHLTNPQKFTPPVSISSGAKTGTLNAGGNGTIFSGCVTSRASGNHVNKCELRYSQDNGVTIGTNGVANTSDNLSIRNSYLHDNCLFGNGAGVEGGWGTGIKIQQNTLTDNGRDQTFSHQLYLDDLDNFDVSYNKINCTVASGNFGFVCHGVVSVGSIHHNWVDSCANGIGVHDGAYGTTESFTTMNVYANKITNCGTLSGQTQGLPMLMASMVNSNIYDNLMYGNKAECNIQDRLNAAAVTYSNNVKFYQNTMDASASASYGFLFAGANFTALDARNNVLYSSASALQAVQKTGIPNAQIGFAYSDIYQPNRANPFKWDSVDYTLATLQSAAFSGLSGTGNIANNCTASNPSFTSVGSDYHLSGGSPAKGTGVTGLGISTDFEGTAFSSPPSMGCYA